jgi:hypothetical protein
MELVEPFHSAKLSARPRLLRDPKVRPYAKSAAKQLIESSRALRRARRADRLVYPPPRNG